MTGTAPEAATGVGPVAVELTADAAAFARDAAEWLIGDPVSANVLAVQLAGTLDATRPAIPGAVWALARDRSGAVVGAAMHTSPVGVFVPRLPDGVSVALADAFADVGRDPGGVTGDRAAAVVFADRWRSRTGRAAHELSATRLHVLDPGLANPTANRLYRRIGFLPHSDGTRLVFLPAGDGSTGLPDPAGP